MTFVITGARGYIGGALSKRLVREGRALRLVSRSFGAQRIAAAPDANIEYCEADLRDPVAWSSLLRGAAAVIHLSSRTDLRVAESDSAGDYNLNVEPVRALVAAAAQCGAQVPVLFASTVTIVGNSHPNPVDESTADRPCSVYDRHKLECETILKSATRRGVISACSLRLSNVYGHGVSSVNANRGILNAIMRRAGEGEALTLYGQGEYIRDFTFIGDVVDAFCRALAVERVRDGGHYVIATGRGHSLVEAFGLVAAEALRCTGRRVEVRHVPEPPDLHAIERRNFVGNSGLFQRLTGWRPQVGLKNGIRDYFAQTFPAARATGTPHAVA
jgi:UDP-glucose 4-epimerase